MEDLVEEYQGSLKKIREAKKGYPAKHERDGQQDIDFGLLSSMERDLQFILKWLTTGRQPGTYQGVERLADYQKEVPANPQWFNQGKLGHPLKLPASKELEEPVRFRIDEALSLLTVREREVYELSRGEGFTSVEIGEMLAISEGAVRKMIQRGEEKIRGTKESNLFLVNGEGI
ncbi:sigma-70 family RNA polymerase sigma factor [Marininema halotolerans]|uniref:RNA polymerase sigma-70 factor, ECF subfamily n=1 Tax=Marininema halotolerans TaxID=1155944 RepID=A0A1I6UQI7_9BACL|nr:sigma-70 family RNA polymerase sigma factor [Marininema halotolerans]SFT03594.1 RNA polymerase sigma-70 factor, ECF subfamily [Marininema halotolerans]